MAEDQQNNSPLDVTIEQLQADLDNAMSGWKRAAADFENYKRQKEKENQELVQFAREVTVAKLLPTLDVLGQALKHLPTFAKASSFASNFAKATSDKKAMEDKSEGEPEYQQSADSSSAGEAGNQQTAFADKYSNWQIGINGILMQLDGVLVELGVKKIDCLGKKFDPHLHEAVREQESDAEDGTIIEELQTGFELNGKVIRPSQVVISKRVTNPSPEASAKGEGDK